MVGFEIDGSLEFVLDESWQKSHAESAGLFQYWKKPESPNTCPIFALSFYLILVGWKWLWWSTYLHPNEKPIRFFFPFFWISFHTWQFHDYAIAIHEQIWKVSCERDLLGEVKKVTNWNPLPTRWAPISFEWSYYNPFFLAENTFVTWGFLPL